MDVAAAEQDLARRDTDDSAPRKNTAQRAPGRGVGALIEQRQNQRAVGKIEIHIAAREALAGHQVPDAPPTSDTARLATRHEQRPGCGELVHREPPPAGIACGHQTGMNIGDRIGTQTGNKIELTSVVDPNILGGIVLRVGDFILDASIRNSLSQLRKQVAHAARTPVSVKEPLNADQA